MLRDTPTPVDPTPFTDDLLSEPVRAAIHDFALFARERLTREAREQLEGVYGLHTDGRLEPASALPALADPEAHTAYNRLKLFLLDETQAGLTRPEAVSKLVKEIAFTHLNRLVAFKMMEMRKLIREAVGRGLNSNGYKHYLADHPDDETRHTRGETETAYRHFLLWQAGEVAREVRVLFDPADLPSAFFPRALALTDVLANLNASDLALAWEADDAIGWVYQYFNEPELQAAFAAVRESGKKFEATDIPAATQLFTLRWVVRFLVENTLGRRWLELHPDSGLRDSLRYLAADPASPNGASARAMVMVKDLTLLDPACGTMHFGLVAFDLFAAMYREELAHAGEPGWPATPSVVAEADIPAAILRHNLFGIDIDLRAVQLAALTLYLKAKRLNKTAKVSDHNLACADVLAADSARLDAFIKTMKFSPIYARLIRALWERLGDIVQLGSLLRLEETLATLIAEERAAFEREGRQMDVFGTSQAKFEGEAAQAEYWEILGAQILQAVDLFAHQQAEAGQDVSFFAREASKGLHVLELMTRRYDVVVTNPPYLSRRKMNKTLAGLLDDEYPEGKGDLYAAFTQRALELVEDGGRVGMLTMHSFMFISSYEVLREHLTGQAAIETLAHMGPGLFATGNPGTLQTAAFTLRREPDPTRRAAHEGVYFRLVHAPDADAKRALFEQAVQTLQSSKPHPQAYRVAQCEFDAIPGKPWAYWVSNSIRTLFSSLSNVKNVAEPKMGMGTRNNSRYLRFLWEIPLQQQNRSCINVDESINSGGRWFPYMKGGALRRWYGNQERIVNFYKDGKELKIEQLEKYPYLSGTQWIVPNEDVYFHEGITWSDLSTKGFGVRYLPPGFAFDVKGSSAFPDSDRLFTTLAIMNSSWMGYALGLLNPTVSFQVGDISRVPYKAPNTEIRQRLEELTQAAVYIRQWQEMKDETTFDFLAPPTWETGLEDLAAAQVRLAQMEAEIDDEVYRLYGIEGADRAAIEAELRGDSGSIVEEEAEIQSQEMEDEAEVADSAALSREELAVRWISYAIGVVLGRFHPGVAGELGSALYRRADFAIGSLPAPEEEEFNQLVGESGRFSYIDERGGRHLFSHETEQALCALAVPDSITVLDENHPRDLPALVARALTLMLGQAVQGVIQIGAESDLRSFLSKDFFTRWHIRQYRKRPVYWPIQSTKRSYGFVLFHEKIARDTFFALQRDPYLDSKRRGVELRLSDQQMQLKGAQGKQAKIIERQIDGARVLAEELAEFAKVLEAITQGGYAPDPDWIDDGVILRLAPLWPVIPLWKTEPKKHWERLGKGDFDWSHIAMSYWPKRVREKCKINKSYAIAHGLSGQLR